MAALGLDVGSGVASLPTLAAGTSPECSAGTLLEPAPQPIVANVANTDHNAINARMATSPVASGWCTAGSGAAASRELGVLRQIALAAVRNLHRVLESARSG